MIAAGPPPVPNVPNAVGNVPASSGGIGGLGFQQGEWDWMSTVLSDPGQWRGAIHARFGVIGEIAYILIAEDAVDNLGTVFGDEVPMHRRAGAVLLILVEVSPAKLAKAVGKADDVYDAVRAANKGLHRPYIRKSTREAVEARAPRDAEGRPLDPNTGNPIEGKPDLGHKRGHEFRRERAAAEAEGLKQRQFNDRMNNADLYQLEDPSSNRSRRFEQRP